MAVAIAVLGKEVNISLKFYSNSKHISSHTVSLLQNSLKYFACLNPELDLQFRYKMHTALDFIEEKLSSAGKPTNDVRELYLGQLYAAEDYKLFVSYNCFLISYSYR